jgi:hypothetical protein
MQNDVVGTVDSSSKHSRASMHDLHRHVQMQRLRCCTVPACLFSYLSAYSSLPACQVLLHARLPVFLLVRLPASKIGCMHTYLHARLLACNFAYLHSSRVVGMQLYEGRPNVCMQQATVCINKVCIMHQTVVLPEDPPACSQTRHGSRFLLCACMYTDPNPDDLNGCMQTA